MGVFQRAFSIEVEATTEGLTFFADFGTVGNYFSRITFNAEPRFRISRRELLFHHQFSAFPRGITKSRLGVKVIREK